MSKLRLRDTTNYPDTLASWPLPIQPPHVGSSELNWLTRELDQYVRGSIRGRSFLIAGHRGSGKTALAMRAVENVRIEIMRQSVIPDSKKLPAGPFQRPLLVKLHGPSMLEPHAKAQSALERETAQSSDAAIGKGGSDGGATTPAAVPKASDAIELGAHAALVQITIGLYRSLASEAAAGFRAHAVQKALLRPGDYTELAASLALSLDSGAEPGMIRYFWDALGRLRYGVFWPATADPTLKVHDMNDQGQREAIALVTAAQAFQVCSGQVSYATQNKDNVVSTETSESKRSSNLKDVVGKLGTLGLGTLTGLSVLHMGGLDVTAAMGSGLAVWLLGSFTLSWSRSRKRVDDRSTDYSFIRDFKPGTLDRDLPVVITRLREAGLAPVFVIDELDKVTDAPSALARLVGRMKHLISDFGFFCFLVNRDCYEAIEETIRTRAYPSEHTLFSDRLLLHPSHEHLLHYLIEQVEGDTRDPQASLARSVFALSIMHEARLNLTDIMRLLARATRDREGSIGETYEITKTPRFVFSTVQIAIGETLRATAVAERMSASASFAQLVLDTLYWPSRLWSDGNLVFDPSREKLKDYLDGRLRPDSSDAEAICGTSVGSSDLELLHTALIGFLELLTDISALRASVGTRLAIGTEGASDPTDVALKDIPPVSLSAICSKEADGSYRFLFTRDGEPPSALQRMTDAQVTRAAFLRAYLASFKLLLAEIGIAFDDLASTPLLTSLSLAAVDLADQGLQAACRTRRHTPAVDEQLATLERMLGEIRQQSEKLGTLLVLIASIRQDVEGATDPLAAILPLIRFEAKPARWLSDGVHQIHPLPDTVVGLDRWREQYRDWLQRSPGDTSSIAAADYASLADLLKGFFTRPQRTIYQPNYQVLLQAARNELPARVLNANMRNMRIGDWSALALAAMPRRNTPASAPYWVLLAALRGLGFGRPGLDSLCDTSLAGDLQRERWIVEADNLSLDICFDLASTFANGAQDRPPGLLLIETDDEPYGQERVTTRRGVLVIHQKDFRDYLPALRWLTAIGIFNGLADAREGPR